MEKLAQMVGKINMLFLNHEGRSDFDMPFTPLADLFKFRSEIVATRAQKG
jgi:hypothetical protein